MGSFVTEPFNPGLTIIAVGDFTIHYDTKKASGSNNYYTYALIYKVTSSGVETLIATSDNSTQTSVNTSVQQTVTAPVTSTIFVSTTDRVIVKVYGVMLSASANINLEYDDATSARLVFPVGFVTLGNLIPYTDWTQNANGGLFGLTVYSITSTNALFINATSTNLNVSSLANILQLGINTSSPISQLSVQGTGLRNPFTVLSSTNASLLTVLTNGNVGIVDTSPDEKLSIIENGKLIIENDEKVE